MADDESLFVTSANLTETALDRNIELGLLVRNRALERRRPLPRTDRPRSPGAITGVKATSEPRLIS